MKVDLARIHMLLGPVVTDHRGTFSGNATLVSFEDERALRATLLASGRIGEVAQHEAWSAAERRGRVPLDLGDGVLLPGLVNAHTHLDLTHIGPMPHDPEDGFVNWVNIIRSARRTDAEGIRESVRLGIERLLAGGVVAVGDIAGAPGGRPTLAAFDALAESPLMGVSYVEFFGIGHRRVLQDRGEQVPTAEQRMAEVEGLLTEWVDSGCPGSREGIRVGLQPHAPNTVEPPVYERTVRVVKALSELGVRVPVCTHLAETVEEREFVGQGTGPQREMLENLGVWHDSVLRHVGCGKSPVRHLWDALREFPMTVVHLNSMTDHDLELLGKSAWRVVYCPRASDYFGAPAKLGEHRYREMLHDGVAVALGTDSIVNLTRGGGDEIPDLTTWDEMRFLWLRDSTDPYLLLRMATVFGARVLDLPESLFEWREGGDVAGIVWVGRERLRPDECPLRAALGGMARPRLLSHQKLCDRTGLKGIRDGGST